MGNGEKPFTDGKARKTGNSIDDPRKNGNESGSQVNAFIDKIEASHAGDSDAPASKSEPTMKKEEDKYSELSESHDALLNELESSMDHSMEELDARYDKEFSRLDSETGTEQESKADAKPDHADRMDARLLECGAAVEKLKARLDQSESDVYKNCTLEIQSLQEQLAAARAKLAGLKDSGDEGHGRIKEGLSNIMADIRQAVKSVIARVKEAGAAK